MAQHQVQSLLVHFGQLFFLCKILGIYPQDLQNFRQTNTLQKSKYGASIVVITMIVIIIFYNMLIYSFSEEDRSLKANQSTLTFVIGLFLTYIGLIMMVTDQMTAVRNQNRIGELFERIRAADERLFTENITINNSGLVGRIRFMIVLSVLSELSILISTYVMLVDHNEWYSVIWIFSCVPTFYNSLDKIWFVVTLFGLKQRFEAINVALEELANSHEKYKAWILGGGGVNVTEVVPAFTVNQHESSMGYLYKELQRLDIASIKSSGKNKIKPISHAMNSFGESIGTPHKQSNVKSMISMAYESELSNTAKVEEKLNNICQMHDEICEIGKTLNELWSYPILILMAYGFLIFTAQLYFLYCGTQNQAIPSLFRSAKNAFITVVYLSYTAGKSIYVIYLSWKTSLESKRTGICLHKCSVAGDNNVLYEIVNHLSLKLLNHSVDFSACGFFTLDMETLYGVSGGITSYLIILIQFNLAAQQAKDAIQTFSNFNETANLVAGSDYRNSSTLIDFITSTIMTTTPDY